MKQKKITTRQLVLTGMMTAVLSVLSILTIPLPSGVPITLQTFAVAFCGYVLGWKMGGAAALLYLILGAVGVPVYAGMSSGFGCLFGPAGGFIFGFIPMAILCGLGTKKGFRGKGLVFGLLGLVSCHLFGILQYAVVTGTSLPASVVAVSVPYWIKDVLSVIGAEIVAAGVKKALRSVPALAGNQTI